MKKKKFQPVVRDDNDSLRRRYNRLAKRSGIQKQTLSQRIFEEGISVLEGQLESSKGE